MIDFQHHYQQLYFSGSLDEWRRAVAVGTAHNVVRCWTEVTISSRPPLVVERGCGDYAVAQELHRLDSFPHSRVSASPRPVPIGPCPKPLQQPQPQLGGYFLCSTPGVLGGQPLRYAKSVAVYG